MESHQIHTIHAIAVMQKTKELINGQTSSISNPAPLPWIKRKQGCYDYRSDGVSDEVVSHICAGVCVFKCQFIHKHRIIPGYTLTEMGKVLVLGFAANVSRLKENCWVVPFKPPSWLNICIPIHIEKVMKEDAFILHLVLVLPACLNLHFSRK